MAQDNNAKCDKKVHQEPIEIRRELNTEDSELLEKVKAKYGAK